MQFQKGTILFMLLFLFSCGGKKTPFRKATNTNNKTNILHLPSLLTAEENDASFPIWFNDSLIQLHGIKKITRKSFRNPIDTDTTAEEIQLKIPREIREYTFNKKGKIIQLDVQSFYDDRPISLTRFIYSKETDKNGFSLPQKHITYLYKKDKGIREDFIDPEKRSMDFRTHEFEKQTNETIDYLDQETGDYIYFISNEEHWGPLAVDSLTKPTVKDYIIFGNPKKPVKKYQVHNKVAEKNVTKYHYHKTDENQLDYWVKNSYPFENKRNFVYSSDGKCTGFMDSTFSNHLFVTRTITEFEYNEFNLPSSITHRKTHHNNQKSFHSIETYTYEK